MNLRDWIFGSGDKRQAQQKDESRDRVAERVAEHLELAIKENLSVTDRLEKMAREMRGMIERDARE